jgi:decaprenyl-phosphate phosphoribosyltransferase
MSTVTKRVEGFVAVDGVDGAPQVQRSSPLLGLVGATRPKQWVKNVLVFAAPGAAGVLLHPAVLGRALVAFVAFCLAASGVYLFNDTFDAEADRGHPVKGRRAVAAGTVSPRAALAAAGALVLGALAVGSAAGGGCLVILTGYVALAGAYTLWLKHIAVIEIAIVASGFVLRAIAGGAAANVAISQWFLIVASFGSLFVVAGKRHGEHLALGPRRADARRSLGVYAASHLRYLWMVSSAVAIGAYCGWAFEQGGALHGSPWYALSIVPFVVGVGRYALLLERGLGTAPEDLILGDRVLQVVGVVWVAVFAAAVYLGR